MLNLKTYLPCSFIKIYDVDGNLSRIVDLVDLTSFNSSGKYLNLYSYEFLLTDSGEYSLPQEFYNSKEVLNNLELLSPGSKRDTLLDLSSCLLPQFGQTKTPNDIALAFSYFNELKGDFYTNIYLVSLPEERSLDLFTSSRDLKDPYGLVDPSNTVRILENLVIDKPQFSNIIYLTLSIDGSTDWKVKSSLMSKNPRPLLNLVESGSFIEDYTKYISEKTRSFFESVDTSIDTTLDSIILKNRKIKAEELITLNKDDEYNSSLFSYTDPF